jgi:hypothetical protein
LVWVPLCRTQPELLDILVPVKSAIVFEWHRKRFRTMAIGRSGQSKTIAGSDRIRRMSSATLSGARHIG